MYNPFSSSFSLISRIIDGEARACTAQNGGQQASKVLWIKSHLKRRSCHTANSMDRQLGALTVMVGSSRLRGRI
jgi:hypothetical protein